jgi:hypothetical protein
MALRQKIFEANNKGLFDIAVGEGNISPNYATELQNSRVALNGEVSKRRGRTFLNDSAIEFAAGNSIDTYATSNQSGSITQYNGNNEQVGLAITLASGQSLQGIKFYLKKLGSPTGVMQAKIFASSGTVGTSGIPTGTVLQTSIDVDCSVLTTSFSLISFWFEEPYVAAAGDICVLLEYKMGDASNNVINGTDSSSPTHGSNVFKTNTSNASWAADTSQDLIFDLLKAGPNVDALMIYEGNYPDNFEILAQADTRVLRYSSLTGAFDTVIKTGLTANKRLNWTMFNNKMMLSNGTDTPFKYGYTPPPFKPTTSTTSSGSKSSRTYYITITYVTANGESVASEEQTQIIPANHILNVNSPVTLAGATGYNVYHHTTSGALKLQTASPLAIGVTYVEQTTLEDGAAPPTAHTGWYVIDLADNPPKGKYIFALNNRVWISGIANEGTRFSGSAVDNEDDWSSASDYVNINLAAVLSRGDEITGLSRLGQTNALIVGLKNHIVTYSVPATFSDIAIDKQVFNTGVMSHRGMDEVGLDNYIVETDGLNSIKSELIVQGLKTRKLSDNIRDRINPLLKAVADPSEINVVNHKAENEFWLNIPSIGRRYVYDYEIKAWMEDRGVTIYQSVRTPDNNILSAGTNGRVYREYTNSSDVNVYGDGNNNTSVSWKWETPWLWFDNISIKKMFKYFQFKGTGSAGLFDLDVSFDFDNSSYKTFNLQSTLSAWDSAGWDGSYWDFPDVNKVLIPMIGMGRAVRFVFTANHKADLSIAFYGVKYVNAGFRAND